MNKENIGKNIKKRRKEIGVSAEQLADTIGVSAATIYRYENGYIEKLPVSSLEPIANALACSPAYLMGWDDAPLSNQSSNGHKGVKIPILGSVPAGIPVEAVEDIIGYEEIPETMARTGEFFGLKVKGDSMETDIHNGDILIIKKQPCADTGNIVVAMINGDEATVKKISITENGIMLIPNNNNYEPMFYTNKQIEDLPVRIIGKVVELHRSF